LIEQADKVKKEKAEEKAKVDAAKEENKAL
jgi:hypothetical protein